MILLLKIWLACFLYDWVLIPFGNAFVKVSLKHFEGVRRIYCWVIHRFIKMNLVELDKGGEVERRERIAVGDLVFIRSYEFGDEVTICTALDLEIMKTKYSCEYYKILGYAEKQGRE